MLECPVCKSSSTELVKSLDSHIVANSFIPCNINRHGYMELKSHLEKLWRDDKVQILRCNDCEICYSDPFIAGDAKFYEISSSDTPYPQDKWEYRYTLDILKSNGKKGSLLDIGAGKGYFLKQLINFGWSPKSLMAAEYSLAGQNAIRELGVACQPADVRELQIDKKFDVICMFQVLEHLDNFDTLFPALNRLLADDGHLFIAVPYGKRIVFNEDMNFLMDNPPNHITRWMPKSFDILARKLDWRVVECKLEPTSLKYEVTYALVNRFIRRSQDNGSWENSICRVASKIPAGSRKIKIAGTLMSPASWVATLKTVAYSTKHGSLPHSLWVHLQKS